MAIGMRVKRVLRPLIPDRLLARYRLHQHSRHSRVNVEVFLQDGKTARRWLGATPDTYRVRRSLPAAAEGEIAEVVDPAIPVPDRLMDDVRRVLADPALDAGVVGEVSTPSLIDRRRAEPPIAPIAIVVRPERLAEVGGVPVGEHPLPGLLARLRDAGHRVGLIPVPPAGAPTERGDPIDLDPVVVLAAVPMHDVGGGARSTQLALELLCRGFHVTLVSLYEAQESVDLGLRFIHPALEQARVERFDPARLRSRCSKAGLVLVEAPAEALAGRARVLQEAGWTVVYDVIDDWSDPALGSEWFRPDVEMQLIRAADGVVASAPDLVERVARMGRQAHLIPNGVNAGVFGVALPPRPADLPEGESIIGYHGSLYGDWFDWGALLRVAEGFPTATVVVIGDDKAPHPSMPPNVHFLGLKPQAELPAYVQRFDVGLVPFVVSDTTHAVSPLKAYEYLASGVPVAAPPLRSLEGLPHVHRSTDLPVAVAQALEAGRFAGRPYLEEHGWSGRITALLDVAGIQAPPTGGTPVRVVSRPVVHHPDRLRAP
jgi:glycosyltransferase involved in cell wall biosynthesis